MLIIDLKCVIDQDRFFFKSMGENKYLTQKKVRDKMAP